MDELMTTLMSLGILGSFLVAYSMAWYVTPPAAQDSVTASERRR